MPMPPGPGFNGPPPGVPGQMPNGMNGPPQFNEPPSGPAQGMHPDRMRMMGGR